MVRFILRPLCWFGFHDRPLWRAGNYLHIMPCERCGFDGDSR